MSSSRVAAILWSAAIVQAAISIDAMAATAATPAQARRILETPLNVAAVAMADDKLWVASRGDGLSTFVRGKRTQRFDVGALPSAVVHDVAPLRGDMLVATDRGLVVIDRKTGASRPINPLADKRQSAAADLVVGSPSGGYAIFQLTLAEQAVEGEHASSLWRLRGDRAEPWDAGLGPGVTATAGYYDRRDRCIHLAGAQGQGAVQTPWHASDCAGKVTAKRLSEGAPTGAIGVAGLTRIDGDGKFLLIVVTQPTANPSSRRFVAMQMQNGKLSAHCSQGSYTEPVTGVANHRGTLLIARRGVGVEAVTCDGSRALSRDQRLRDVTALVEDPQAGVLAGTGAAVLQIRDDGTTAVLAESAQSLLPVDTLPMQASRDGTRVLFSSPTAGPVELQRTRDVWTVARTWRPGVELPTAVYGSSCYADDEEVLTIALSTGVLRLAGRGVAAKSLASREPIRAPLDIVCDSRGAWVAVGSTPMDTRGAGLHFIRKNGESTFLPLKDRQVQPGGGLLTWPDGKVWVGTRVGVIEVSADGASTRISTESVNALYRNEARGIVGVVGATIQYWNADRFVPVLFAVPAPALGTLGHPTDLVIDDAGRWIILYSGGHVVVLDERRQFAATLSAAAGIPASSRRLLYLPSTRETLIGSGREGVFSLRLPGS